MNNQISSKIKKGSIIPDFKLRNAKNEIISSDIFLRKSNLVILFFSSLQDDDCQRYLEMLNDICQQLKNQETEILAVSQEIPENVAKFNEEKKIKFNLLSDSGREASNKFITKDNLDKNACALFITDRFNSLYKVYLGGNFSELPNKEEILSWAEFLEKQCPECGVSTWPEDLE